MNSEKFGERAGFLVMYFIFATIFYFIFSNVINHRGFNYYVSLWIVLFIVLFGMFLKAKLK
jgi:hypothetical protein